MGPEVGLVYRPVHHIDPERIEGYLQLHQSISEGSGYCAYVLGTPHPAHGVVQLFANVTRTWIFRRQLVWPVIWRFALLLPVGAALGLLVFQGLPDEIIKMLIGVFMLLTLLSERIRRLKEWKLPLWSFLPIGFLTGILNMVVGVIGPVLATLVVRYGIRKEGVVGTLGFFGIVGNVTKIIGLRLVLCWKNVFKPFSTSSCSWPFGSAATSAI